MSLFVQKIVFSVFLSASFQKGIALRGKDIAISLNILHTHTFYSKIDKLCGVPFYLCFVSLKCAQIENVLCLLCVCVFYDCSTLGWTHVLIS